MNTPHAKKVFRIVAIVVALLGLGNLACTPHFYAQPGIVKTVIGTLFVSLALYFLYVGHLCWWRPSPRAIRHACAVEAYLLLAAIGALLKPLDAAFPQEIGGLFALVAFIGVVWLWSRSSRYFTRLFFGEQRVQSLRP